MTIDQIIKQNEQEQENFQLVTDSQEITEILNYFGVNEDYQTDITSLFVLVGDGEFLEVYATESNTPYLTNTEFDLIDYWLD